MRKKEIWTLPARFRITLDKYPQAGALAFAGEKPMTYTEVNKHIRGLIALLEKTGIQPGDRVGLLGTNMPQWAISYFAITFMGAVAVPLLPDFHPDEIIHILEHSGAKVMFVSETLFPKVKDNLPEGMYCLIAMEDDRILVAPEQIFSFDPEAVTEKDYVVDEEDMAAIIYTSGTTGKSKGVMLTHKNLVFNALKSTNVHPIGPEDRFLSILPLSHTYENTIGLIIPMVSGSCVYYLKKPPTPAVLIPAMQKVKPTLMLTVPLIIEKIYKKQILPAFTKNGFVRKLYKISPTRKMLNKMAGKKLIKTFGGELNFFGIGGAKLNKKVEEFLLEAHFPYAVGYGLTETSPLIAGFGTKNQRLQSTGPAIEGLEIKIHDPDPETGEGEIWVRGPSVMKGYYKEPELTKEVITGDGWFKTGDLGILDKDRYLFIKGRSKNVIIGPGGENVYPEDIESVINNFWFVDESLVVEEKGKLVALVHLNVEAVEKKFLELKENAADFYNRKVDSLLKEVKEYVNSRVNRFSRVQTVKQHDPFVKTATNKIKRYLYNKDAGNRKSR